MDCRVGADAPGVTFQHLNLAKRAVWPDCFPQVLVLKRVCLRPSETPLTLAAQLADPVEVIKALKNGGAHLDFRAKDGMTALHKAVRASNPVALKVCSEPALHGRRPLPTAPVC